MCKAYIQCCPSPDQQDLFFWKYSGQLVCQTYSVASVQRPTRPILLRAANVAGIYSKAPVLINTTSPPGNAQGSWCVRYTYSVVPVQTNKTYSSGNAQGSWCVRHTVLPQSRPTRPILLEMLKAAGVSDIQCCPSSDQHDLSFWKCSGQLLWQAFSKAPVLINTTSPPGNAQGSWCVKAYIQCCPSPDQQDLFFCKCSRQLVCQTYSVAPVQTNKTYPSGYAQGS